MLLVGIELRGFPNGTISTAEQGLRMQGAWHRSTVRAPVLAPRMGVPPESAHRGGELVGKRLLPCARVSDAGS
ncbi:MAG: hypothetical protein IPK13_17180 [Deltaproteobacteria bacterium]|nr:hypothetical protein [Deltaproteobacteria bacterium]